MLNYAFLEHFFFLSCFSLVRFSFTLCGFSLETNYHLNRILFHLFLLILMSCVFSILLFGCCCCFLFLNQIDKIGRHNSMPKSLTYFKYISLINFLFFIFFFVRNSIQLNCFSFLWLVLCFFCFVSI